MSTLPRCSKIKGLLGGTGQPLCQRLELFRQQHRCHRWVVHPSVEVDDTDSFTERCLFFAQNYLLYKHGYWQCGMSIRATAWTCMVMVIDSTTHVVACCIEPGNQKVSDDQPQPLPIKKSKPSRKSTPASQLKTCQCHLPRTPSQSGNDSCLKGDVKSCQSSDRKSNTLQNWSWQNSELTKNYSHLRPRPGCHTSSWRCRCCTFWLWHQRLTVTLNPKMTVNMINTWLLTLEQHIKSEIPKNPYRLETNWHWQKNTSRNKSMFG